MKTIVGATRKFAFPFLEYLDRIHFTIRWGMRASLPPPGLRDEAAPRVRMITGNELLMRNILSLS
jgi:hypothetical protein